MNATKAAASISLLIAIAAIGFLLYQVYENVVLLRSSIDAWDGIHHSDVAEYWIPVAIAIIAFIASLALFGSAKNQGGR